MKMLLLKENILLDYLAAELTVKELKLKYKIESKDLAQILLENRIKILEYNNIKAKNEMSTCKL